MKLRAIDDASLPEAIAVLSRGFPERTASFWKEGLERMCAYRRAADAPPIGRLLEVKGRPVGVILTIGSRHRTGSGEREVVNLSSWYIDKEYRVLAPRMLESIVADDNVVFTDLTPNPVVTKINERFGFRTAARGLRLYLLPWTAISAAAGGRMMSVERAPSGALPAADRELLDRHRQLGCIAAVLELDGSYYPFLFQPARRKGMPVARLLLAPNRYTVVAHRAAIARFLLRRGIVFMTFHGDTEGAEKDGSLLWNRSASVQVKGKWEPDRIDHTYSELVFLRL